MAGRASKYMILERIATIALPSHAKEGGFDHAAVDAGRARLYVAHTANDAIDVVDCEALSYLHSLPGLPGVAGALVSEADGRVFTSNRGENTVGVFAPGDRQVAKISVGVRPNGLAYDGERRILLAANVGDPGVIDVIDAGNCQRMATVKTEPGAHTIGFDAARSTVFAFLPQSHSAAVYKAGR